MSPNLPRECRGSGSKATVQVTLSSGEYGIGYKESATVTSSELQKRVFLLLSDVLTMWPATLRTSCSRESPLIWVDGRGTILKASNPTTKTSKKFTVLSRHDKLHKDEVLMRGYRMAAEVPRTINHQLLWGASKTCNPLWSVWMDLRRTHWFGHGVRRPRAMELGSE
jgi:hypothetical protein